MIRPAALPEIPMLADFYYAMLEELGMLHDPLVPNWRQIFVDHHTSLMAEDLEAWYVAECDGAIAGSSCAMRDASPYSKMHAVRSGIIIGVYVKPDFRRRGLSRELAVSCLEWFREHDVKRVRLHASPYARPLYESLGFRAGVEMRLDLD